MSILSTDPILSCEESLAFEKKFFDGDEDLEWQAMNKAGEGVGDALLRDMRELRTIPHRPRVLALVGKGHNGGDAVLATKRFLRIIPTARAVIVPLAKWEDCRPLTQRAWEELKELAEKRIEVIDPFSNFSEELEKKIEDRGFDALIDGLLGMQAKLPLRDPIPALIKWINDSEKIAVRASVDLPTGVTGEGSENPLRADFTYCTGIVKEPVLDPVNAECVGRLRYLNLDFFTEDNFDDKQSRVLHSNMLQVLRKLRPVIGDKRSLGQLFLLAGSRQLGGAAMMAAEGALKAGVGLLTVGIPESLHASFVAKLPEAMWVPLPETPDGSLALEGLGKIRQVSDRATALVAGPGLGTEKETHSLVREVCNFFDGSVLLDADAIRPEIFEKLKSPQNLVITPHAGEFERLAPGSEAKDWSKQNPCTLVLKGAHTQIFKGQRQINCLGGSSVLARGGSGDLLSGIMGGLLAKNTFSPEDAACLAVLWHGRAAEVLARQHGQEAIRSTEILNYLSFAIRNDF
jgi:hydroxyethylthiazole kinase-like uncharacterized protein yjeF